MGGQTASSQAAACSHTLRSKRVATRCVRLLRTPKMVSCSKSLKRCSYNSKVPRAFFHSVVRLRECISPWIRAFLCERPRIQDFKNAFQECVFFVTTVSLERVFGEDAHDGRRLVDGCRFNLLCGARSHDLVGIFAVLNLAVTGS